MKETVYSHSIFDSFNAKSLTPSQVARTFVSPPYFDELIKKNNHVLVGPRGSGKTTLLKMLQQKALENWESDEAEKIIKKIDYCSIFIPMEERWKKQIDNLGNNKLSEAVRNRIGIATYTTNLLREVIISFINLVSNDQDTVREFKRVSLTQLEEKKIVNELAKRFKVEPTTPTFYSLKHSLTYRLAEIFEYGTKLAAMDEASVDKEVADHPYLYSSFLELVLLAVEVFDDYSGKPDNKWALCFDELELAPDYISKYLLENLRSSQDKFIFKLAISPSHHNDFDFFSVKSAVPYNDFDPIRLWYIDQNETNEFCKKLWKSMLRDKGIEVKDSFSILQDSYLDTPPLSNSEVYRNDGDIAKLFGQFYENDESFKKYLDGKGVSPYKLESLDEKRKDSVVRKVKPVLELREYCLNIEDKNKGRSRKVHDFYSGEKTLFAISEGNPRWFIGIFNPLLKHYKNKGYIPKTAQSRYVKKVSNTFSSMLKTVPVGEESKHLPNGIISLIRIIADFIQEEYMGEEFKPEPKSTFIVDSNINPFVEKLLKTAHRMGAIVYISDDNEFIFSSINGKRFRISYLLSPTYKLPITKGRPVSLNTLLKKTMTSKQKTLFQIDK